MADDAHIDRERDAEQRRHAWGYRLHDVALALGYRGAGAMFVPF